MIAIARTLLIKELKGERRKQQYETRAIEYFPGNFIVQNNG